MDGTNSDETQVYQDLMTFLRSPRDDLRLEAAQALISVPTERLEEMVSTLLPLIGDGRVRRTVLQALLRLSCHRMDIFLQQDSQKLVNRLMEVLLSVPPQQLKQHRSNNATTTTTNNNNNSDNDNDWAESVDAACGILSNLTRIEEYAVDFVGRSLPDEAVFRHDDASAAHPQQRLPPRPTMDLVVARFFSDRYVSPEHDPYQHVANILMNVTSTTVGRQFVLQLHPRPSDDGTPLSSSSSLSVLERLLPQLRLSNMIRRRGIAGMIRNVCLERDSTWWMLHTLHITRHILYPLAGPEALTVDEKQGLDPELWLQGPDKQRETDHYTRLFLVEAILLLCQSGRQAREKLRLDKVYTILKLTDMVEEMEDVSEQINECVQYLRRDEAGTEEGSSDKFVESTYRRPAPIVGIPEDLDEVD